MRVFVLRKSSAVDNRMPAPVVFVFHPYGMSAQYMESRVSSRNWPGAIFVYPEGASRPGSGFAPAWQGRLGEFENRDLSFFDAMVAWLSERQCIDRRRIVAFGYSNGAGFAGLLACERADTIAAVAMASGRLGCVPRTARPAALTHGVNDSTIPYSEGVRAAAAWTTQNGCKAPPAVGKVGCFAATGCRDVTPVMMCTSAGGHEYSSAFTRAALELFQKLPVATSATLPGALSPGRDTR